MKTGFQGTFVIPWTQTAIEGQQAAPVTQLTVGTEWIWSGDAVRVDGPAGILPLGASMGEADIRKRAAHSVRKLLATAHIDFYHSDPDTAQDPLFDDSFRVTNGYNAWTITLIGTGAGRNPLVMFMDDIPPRNEPLWVVDHRINTTLRHQPDADPGGVVCFTPGTMIMTPQGAVDVASLAEGDVVQTADNGQSEILWVGQRRVTGARLRAQPALTPIRLRAGALDKDVPDAGLLVSPDHRMVLRGPRARSLYNAEEVLVTARDLVNDDTIVREHGRKDVTYIHVLLPKHEVVFANGVATESFHPAAASQASLDPMDRARMLDRLPELRGDLSAYGDFARRVLSGSEAAIMHHDAARP